MALFRFSSSVPGAEGSTVMTPSFSRNAIPFLGLALKAAAPARRTPLRSFWSLKSDAGGADCHVSRENLLETS